MTTNVDNAFEAPKADLTHETDGSNVIGDLASRWTRLGASLIDTIIMMLLLIPAAYFMGFFETIMNGTEPSIIVSIGMAILGLIVFIIINFKFLKDNGQTVGKKLLGIKIVDLNGDKPEMKTHLLKRYATFFIPQNIPVVGSVFGFVNVLFIFRKDKRCIHDLAGGTAVVKCSES